MSPTSVTTPSRDVPHSRNSRSTTTTLPTSKLERDFSTTSTSRMRRSMCLKAQRKNTKGRRCGKNLETSWKSGEKSNLNSHRFSKTHLAISITSRSTNTSTKVRHGELRRLSPMRECSTSSDAPTACRRVYIISIQMRREETTRSSGQPTTPKSEKE